MNQKSYNLVGRKLFVALPAYDFKISVKLAVSLAELAQKVAEHGIQITIGSICGCSVVSRARNLLAYDFLAGDYTDLLFIDADINFKADDAIRLLAWTTNYGIVAGVPRTRKEPTNYIVTMDEDADGYLTMDSMGLVRTQRVATAFMMVQRKVFEDLKAAHPEWLYMDVQNDKQLYSFFDFKSTPEGYVGEDFLFCDRARALGHEVWVDPTIELGHMGVMEYMGRFGNDVVFSSKAMNSAA